ncbi:hypothetical protein TRAPUB_7463 [Trametes pubescens]|uniref:Uncharacterized protein n=1 Tax=Trametes pubescens TaxID=154538 RepID=A0A1M2V3C4_TRAPU|nr:hypothetical protein TRAPUB_7463 [Trametes pubescens]
MNTPSNSPTVDVVAIVTAHTDEDIRRLALIVGMPGIGEWFAPRVVALFVKFAHNSPEAHALFDFFFREPAFPRLHTLALSDVTWPRYLTDAHMRQLKPPGPVKALKVLHCAH